MQSKSWSNVATAVAFQIALTAGAALSGWAAASEPIKPATTIKIDLPSQPLSEAIQSVARQTNTNILVDPRLIAGRQAPAINRQMSIDQALSMLLQGTGLMPKFVDEKTITLIEREGTKPSAGIPGNPDAMRIAQAEIGSPNQTNSPNTGSPNSDSPNTTLEELIVSAQKRTENLQDVPVPVTAINAATLVSNNQLRLQDYYTNVPGFMVAPTSSQTSQIIAIRGLTTGQGAPTVGIVIDDVPYGSSTALGGGQGIPDLDPGDLTRIEVLRGPQGTLYGANSLGGLAKFVTVDPSTAALSGRLQAGLGSVRNGDEIGYNVRGSVNVPISDTFAVRASGFTRLEPGWIDNPARNIDGINEETASGGRVSALWQPSDSLSLKLSAMVQKSESDGVSSADVLPGLGSLEQSYTLDTANEKEVKAYSAILTAKLGVTTLTSLTGFNISSFDSQSDVTSLYSDFSELFFGVRGTALTAVANTEKLSQEVRLAIPIGTRLDWLVGAYYTKEDTEFDVDFLAVDESTQEIVDHYVYSDFPTTYKEIAGFTNLTVRVTDRFDVQVGGRYSDIKQHAIELDEGAIYNSVFFFPPRPNPFLSTPPDLKANSFTYLVTPRFNVTPDLMVYARFASGYRAGGVNITSDVDVPQGYDPDKTQNYELGVKANFLDNTLAVDASVYKIDWDDVQLFLASLTSGAGYIDNGGKATSEGVELSIQSKPATGLTIGGWVAFNTAELSGELPPGSSVLAGDGDRLPFSAKFSGKLSAEQTFPLSNHLNGFIGADVSYLGERRGTFVRAGERSVLPAYARTDVRLGAHYESWTANLFVNNVTDRRGILVRGEDGGLPFSVNYIQPRTIGLSVIKIL